MRKIYPDLSHAHDWEAAIAATSFVPDEVVVQLCEALGLIGVRNLYLMTLQTFAPPEPELAAFRDVVFPWLGAAGLRPGR